MMKMRSKFIISVSASSLLLFFFFFFLCDHVKAQQPTTEGYTCPQNQSYYPCQTYVHYLSAAPDFLNLAAVGDLFSVSRPMISRPSNISSVDSPLLPNQSLLIPIQCSCNTINTTTSISFAGLNYTINPGDTFYQFSTIKYQNLTTYQSVEVVNPSLVPTNLPIGVNVIFPIFCRCPTPTQSLNRTNYLISYVIQPSDTLPSVAARFNTTAQAISGVNGNVTNPQPYDTVFVPVSSLPQLNQPVVAASQNSSGSGYKKRVVVGLGIGLGISGLLLVVLITSWGYRESVMRKREKRKDEERREAVGRERKGFMKNQEAGGDLLGEVAEYLDKYKVYGVDELKKATQGFDESFLIGGSVYKASLDGEFFAIKKMKWNAYEELKILQKVNHGNLVKLEGFCIDSEEANCYLVYEYVENGSLHSWLHTRGRSENLSWKTRLRIAVDVANGLQYIHEHTRPRVVHKDIRSSKVLLDSSMRAKISDFGLAKSGCNAITMHIVGTQGLLGVVLPNKIITTFQAVKQ